uniref:hypothetical protein n=1 Tax=Actinosynnema sp. TaxID=1872144 RepID=UPI003F8309F6
MTFHDDIRPLIAAETALLAPTLYDAVSLGLGGAQTRMRGIDLSKYPAQFSGLVRMEVREELEARALPDGWSIGGEPRQMAQLLLEHEEYNMVLRFLKENRSNPGRVPHAGLNKARRDIWSRRETPLDLGFGWEEQEAKGEPATFLLLWGPVNPLNLDLGFTLRVVHTVEPGNHLRGVTCDMEIELLQGGAIFERLEFAGAAAAGALFQGDI